MIDHLLQRSDVDGKRIGVWGGSYGGYWAAKLAFVEAKRIKGAVLHGGNVHYGFQEKWLVPALTQTASTYLFGPASLFEVVYAMACIAAPSSLSDFEGPTGC